MRIVTDYLADLRYRSEADSRIWRQEQPVLLLLLAWLILAENEKHHAQGRDVPRLVEIASRIAAILEYSTGLTR